MSDPKDPIDPKEATEARLCAYLENELPPAERAEIEQHLAANPQHRQLLADLAKTRDWMRTIPPEPSPVDMAEIYQGQVERSMLLDEPRDAAGWMVRLPQFALVAAAVALFIGLGVLLFAMLRGPSAGTGTPGGRSFSMASPTASATSLPTERAQSPSAVVSAKTVDLSDGPAAPPPATPPPSTPVAATPVPAAPITLAPVKTATNDELAPKSLGMLGGRIETSDPASLKREVEHLGYQLPADQKTICFVVTADSPGSTIDQVRGFFQRHQLVFDDVTGGSPLPVAVMANVDRAAKAASPTTQTVAMEKDQLGAAGTAAQAPQAQLQAANQNNNGVNVDQAALDAAPALHPSTQPSGQAMYVAHGLSQLQVELLAASLATDNPRQTVQRVTLSEGSVTTQPTTLPTGGGGGAGAVARGQTLTVTVAQLVGPGIDKTNAVKVTDDGTISLPMMDPLMVLGLTPPEIERRIADKYREMNLIPQATVTVSTTTAGTQPVAIATTMPTTPVALATTQPAAPMGPPAGTDVVVLVEKAASILPGK